MTSTTPTIQTLKGKTRRELRAIFRQAAARATSAAATPAERVTATKTMETVRSALRLKPSGF